MAIGPGHLWAAPARGLGYPRLAQGKMIFAATTFRRDGLTPLSSPFAQAFSSSSGTGTASAASSISQKFCHESFRGLLSCSSD